VSRHGIEWIYGRHAVASVLEGDPAGVREIWLQTGLEGEAGRSAEAVAQTYGIAIQRVGKKTLDRRLGDVVHQGVAVRYRPTSKRAVADLDDILERADERCLLLLLDGVTDPQNLGACLRTADAAGADAVITPRHRAAGITPVVRKIASGAAERMPFVQVSNLAQALARMASAGILTVGTAAEAKTPIYDADLSGPVALVLGGEERGLRRLTRERCDLLVSLPMAARAESLNVAVAAGICLFEARRQRLLRGVAPVPPMA
jgi:23S rRNA (guanosine2251-2'-O)-methyltransferase